jgi:hypothetical protein
LWSLRAEFVLLSNWKLMLEFQEHWINSCWKSLTTFSMIPYLQIHFSAPLWRYRYLVSFFSISSWYWVFRICAHQFSGLFF